MSSNGIDKLELGITEDINLGSIQGHFANANPPPPPITALPPPSNGAVLGLFSFGSTTIILSLYNAHASGITIPNVVVSMALFVGGVSQFTGGIIEFCRRSTFTGSVFCIYGAFWLSYGAILLPGTGITAAYEGEADMLGDALGIYLVVWSIVTVMFLIVALRKTVALIFVLAVLALTFLLLGIAEFTGNAAVAKAGGIMGVIPGFGAFYIGLADLLAADPFPPFLLPQGVIKH
ncbi:FUN34 transmembrane protein [Desarmillaria tabescens]|uniref:FUN34 transmembrane protein n=1 Tax=Armillaria tabescens TaxID=1929756 RepID=A0AA39T3Z8_ARMTA|nr:FUN34 transmembrane protein [Desarmillaria tabescens]KAK0462971.1 FUN34 transmembrane protein [Desarmillaria tabescens]